MRISDWSSDVCSSDLTVQTLPSSHFRSEMVAVKKRWISLFSGDCGAPGKIRTPNLLIRSQMLYPVELRAHGKAYSSVVAAARRRDEGGHYSKPRPHARPSRRKQKPEKDRKSTRLNYS